MVQFVSLRKKQIIITAGNKVLRLYVLTFIIFIIEIQFFYYLTQKNNIFNIFCESTVCNGPCSLVGCFVKGHFKFCFLLTPCSSLNLLYSNVFSHRNKTINSKMYRYLQANFVPVRGLPNPFFRLHILSCDTVV